MNAAKQEEKKEKGKSPSSQLGNEETHSHLSACDETSVNLDAAPPGGTGSEPSSSRHPDPLRQLLFTPLRCVSGSLRTDLEGVLPFRTLEEQNKPRGEWRTEGREQVSWY